MESLGLAMAEVGHDRRDQVHLQYQWVKLTCLQCCTQGYKTRNLHNKEVSRLAVSDCVASGNANENCLPIRERKGEISRFKENVRHFLLN